MRQRSRSISHIKSTRFAELYSRSPAVFNGAIEGLASKAPNALLPLLLVVGDRAARDGLKAIIARAGGELLPYFNQEVRSGVEERDMEKEKCNALNSTR